MASAVEKAEQDVKKTQENVDKLSKDKDDLQKELEEKQKALNKEKAKPESEQDQGAIRGLTTDLMGISDKLKALKEALEAAAKALKELQPILEGFVKLGEALAQTVLDLISKILDAIAKIVKSITDLLKGLVMLIKTLLIFPLLLQKLFGVTIEGSITTQPLADLPTTVLTSVTERDAAMLKDRGIETVGALAGADLARMQLCGISVERVSVLRDQAASAVRPFGNEFLYLLEELDMSLPDVARKADADFVLPRARVRAIKADILSRGALLRPGTLDAIRVGDVIDIQTPAGFAFDCFPAMRLQGA